MDWMNLAILIGAGLIGLSVKWLLASSSVCAHSMNDRWNLSTLLQSDRNEFPARGHPAPYPTGATPPVLVRLLYKYQLAPHQTIHICLIE